MAKLSKNALLLKALGLSVEFGFIIALPLIILGLLGKWLDTRMHTGYWIILGVLVALGTSISLIGKKLHELSKELK